MSDDEKERESGSGMRESQGQAKGGRSPHPAYELFVLGQLMDGPTYGYKLRDIVQRILGPFHRLSWGTLYPLIRKLEMQGLIVSGEEQKQSVSSQEERGPSRKQYHLTEAGRARFFDLILDESEFNSDYLDVFMVKVIKFGYLTPAQRLAILQRHREFLTTLHQHYYTGSKQVALNPGITASERPYILHIASYHIRTLETELAWVDSMIAETTAK